MTTSTPPTRTPPSRPTPSTTKPTTMSTRTSAPAPAVVPGAKGFSISSGPKKKGQRIVVYGTGGVGKSSLTGLLPHVRFIDINSQGTSELDVDRVEGIKDFGRILEALREDSLWKGVDTIAIDSGTDAEEMAIEHTIQTVKHEKGHTVKALEGYGWGKGYSHLYDTFLTLLAELDRHVEAGRNVVLICHAVVAKVPNPSGEDFSQYQPALQENRQGNIRSRVQAWCDHMLFINYDVAAKDGKGTGQGTRTIYVNERPSYWAKSRKLEAPVNYPKGDDQVWRELGLIQ